MIFQSPNPVFVLILQQKKEKKKKEEEEEEKSIKGEGQQDRKKDEKVRRQDGNAPNRDAFTDRSHPDETRDHETKPRGFGSVLRHQQHLHHASRWTGFCRNLAKEAESGFFVIRCIRWSCVAQLSSLSR